MSDFYGSAGAPQILDMPERPRKSVFDGTIGPWSRPIGRYKGHVCHLDRRGEVYDYAPTPQGWRYVGKAVSKEDAFNKWKNFLYTIGIEPSGAKRVRK